MSGAIDASDTGGDPKVFKGQESLDDAKTAAMHAGYPEDNVDEPVDEDKEDDLTADEPTSRPILDGPDEGAAEQTELDGPDEGAAERAELAALLRNLDEVDDRAFTLPEQEKIGREIDALRAEVGNLTVLTLQQREAIDQLLTKTQRDSEQMGRKDWVTYAIGAATSLVIMEMVPPLALLPLAVHAIHALGPLLVSP